VTPALAAFASARAAGRPHDCLAGQWNSRTMIGWLHPGGPAAAKRTKQGRGWSCEHDATRRVIGPAACSFYKHGDEVDSRGAAGGAPEPGQQRPPLGRARGKGLTNTHRGPSEGEKTGPAHASSVQAVATLRQRFEAWFRSRMAVIAVLPGRRLLREETGGMLGCSSGVRFELVGGVPCGFGLPVPPRREFELGRSARVEVPPGPEF